MCTSPYKYNVKYRSVRTYYNCDTIIIPCGKCEECISAKKSSMHLRAFFQHVQTLVNGGYMFFETLTYNDQHLPTMLFDIKNPWELSKVDKSSPDWSPQPTKVSLPYPDYDDVQNFWKRLRSNSHRYLAHRRGIKPFSKKGLQILDSIAGNLKYICCTDFGKENHRPHYHFALWCNLPLFPTELKLLLNKSWRGIDFVPDDSQRTLVYSDKDLGMLDEIYSLRKSPRSDLPVSSLEYNTITSLDLHAVGYTTKYLTKSDSSEQWHREQLNLGKDDKLPSELVPRVICSSNLGYDVFKHYDKYEKFLNSHYSNIDWNKLELTIPTLDKKETSGFVTLPIPQYYVNKMYYINQKVVDPSTGESMFTKLVREPWQIESLDYPDYVDVKLNQLSDKVQYFTEKYEKLYNQLPYYLRPIIDEKMCGYDYSDLALYRIFLYGKVINNRILCECSSEEGFDWNRLARALYQPNPPTDIYSDDLHVVNNKLSLWYDVTRQVMNYHYPFIDDVISTLETEHTKCKIDKNARAQTMRVCDEKIKDYIDYLK